MYVSMSCPDPFARLGTGADPDPGSICYLSPMVVAVRPCITSPCEARLDGEVLVILLLHLPGVHAEVAPASRAPSPDEGADARWRALVVRLGGPGPVPSTRTSSRPSPRAVVAPTRHPGSLGASGRRRLDRALMPSPSASWAVWDATRNASVFGVAPPGTRRRDASNLLRTSAVKRAPLRLRLVAIRPAWLRRVSPLGKRSEY